MNECKAKKIEKTSLSSSQSKPTPSCFPYIGSEISLCPSTVHAVSWPDCWGDPLFPSIPSQVPPPPPLKTSFLYYTLFAYVSFFRIFLGERSGWVVTGDEKYLPCPPPWPEIVRGKSRHHRIFFFRCCHATFSFSFAEWKDEYHFWYGICRISQIVIKQKYPKFSIQFLILDSWEIFERVWWI